MEIHAKVKFPQSAAVELIVPLVNGVMDTGKGEG